jgi:hypothetical protein
MGELTGSIVSQVSIGVLTPVVRQVVKDEQAEVSEYTCQPVGGGAELASSIVRVSGTAKIRDGSCPWSVILKVVTPSPLLADPQGVRHWEREALAYESGVLRDLPGGMSAPECYGVVRQPDGSVWLWLEDLSDAVFPVWPLAYYGSVARYLGRSNGAYAEGREFPVGAWVTRGWLAAYVEQAAEAMAFIRANPDDPLVKRIFPGPSRTLILLFWDERERLLALLDRLPQTLCHQDAFRRNLFSQPEGVVAIDWGYAGVAPLGAELVALVGGSIAFGELAADQIRDLDQTAFDAYLEGLSEAGWHGRRRDVRLAYVLSAMLRYVIGGSVGETFGAMLAGESSPIERGTGRSVDDEVQDMNEEAAYYTGLFKEALGLLGIPRVLGMVLRAISRALAPGTGATRASHGG